MSGDASYDPSKNVQELISSVRSPKYKTHQVFCEMDILKQRGDTYEWRESGRSVVRLLSHASQWSVCCLTQVSGQFAVSRRGRSVVSLVSHAGQWSVWCLTQVSGQFAVSRKSVVSLLSHIGAGQCSV